MIPIAKIAGIAMILGAIIGFFLAGLPIVANIFGGSVADTLQHYAVNIYWILPVGFYLLVWDMLPIHMRLWALIPVIIAIFILYVIFTGELPLPPWMGGE